MMCCGPYRYVHSIDCKKWGKNEEQIASVQDLHDLDVGDHVWMQGERQKYTVQARDERWVILTKPFNVQHTVIYTIVDLEHGVKGTDDLVFSTGYETREQCEENLERLASERMEISQRNHAALYVGKVQIAAQNERDPSGVDSS